MVASLGRLTQWNDLFCLPVSRPHIHLDLPHKAAEGLRSVAFTFQSTTSRHIRAVR